MNAGLRRVESEIYKSSDVVSCMKALDLSLNSYFSLLLEILEENILDYHEGFDYENLKKVANYIKHIYTKLKLTSKSSYRKEIISLLKIYKRMSECVDTDDAEALKNIAEILASLLDANLNKPHPLSLNENPLTTLLIEAIFGTRKLEYIDKLLKIDEEIINATIDDKSLFIVVIKEYLNEIINNDDYLISFYERVINKFLINDKFNLDNNIKNESINLINEFINSNKVDINRLIRLKKIIMAINNKTDLFLLFDINNLNVKESSEEEARLREPKNSRIILDDYIITIDDIDTQVLDDSLSVTFLGSGNVLFKVHIADPLAVFDYASPLINDAKKKAMTIYLSDKQIPMIDYKLASDDLSLKAGDYRYAKTFCFLCDREGNIIDRYFLNTIIKVTKRESYKSINEIYKNGGGNQEEERVFTFLENFLQKLKEEFKRVERFIEYEASLDILETNNKIGSFSTNLVTYAMLLTGFSVADYFDKNNLPYLYRCHELDDLNIKLITDLILDPDNGYYLKILRNLRGNTPKSFYTRFNCGHFGLGFSSYSHITSPLRRFSDILNMHILNKCYFSTPSDKDIYELEREIDKVARMLNLERNTIEDYVRESEKVKKCL